MGEVIEISHKNSLLACDILDMYLILKSYADNQAPVVEQIYLILRDASTLGGRRVLTKIKLNELKKANSLEKFKEWWSMIVQKSWQYEKSGQKINFLIVISQAIAKEGFDLRVHPSLFIRPIYPWNPEILKKIEIEEDFIEELKNLLKKSHNYKDE